MADTDDTLSTPTEVINQVSSEVMAELRTSAKEAGKDVGRQKAKSGFKQAGFFGKIADKMGLDSVGSYVGKKRAEGKFDDLAKDIEPKLKEAGDGMLADYAETFDLTPQEIKSLQADMKASTLEVLRPEVEQSVKEGQPTTMLWKLSDPNNQESKKELQGKLEAAMVTRLGGSGGFIEQKVVALAVNDPVKLAQIMKDRPKLVTESAVGAVISDDKAFASVMANDEVRKQLLTNSTAQAAVMKNPDSLSKVMNDPKMQQDILTDPPFAAQLARNPKLVEALSGSPLLQEALKKPTVVSAVLNDPAALNAVAGNRKVMDEVVKHKEILSQVLDDPAKLEAVLKQPNAVAAVMENDAALEQVTQNPKAQDAIAKAALADPNLQAELLKHPNALAKIDKANPKLAGQMFDMAADGMGLGDFVKSGPGKAIRDAAVKDGLQGVLQMAQQMGGMGGSLAAMGGIGALADNFLKGGDTKALMNVFNKNGLQGLLALFGGDQPTQTVNPSQTVDGSQRERQEQPSVKNADPTDELNVNRDIMAMMGLGGGGQTVSTSKEKLEQPKERQDRAEVTDQYTVQPNLAGYVGAVISQPAIDGYDDGALKQENYIKNLYTSGKGASFDRQVTEAQTNQRQSTQQPSWMDRPQTTTQTRDEAVRNETVDGKEYAAYRGVVKMDSTQNGEVVAPKNLPDARAVSGRTGRA